MCSRFNQLPVQYFSIIRPPPVKARPPHTVLAYFGVERRYWRPALFTPKSPFVRLRRVFVAVERVHERSLTEPRPNKVVFLDVYRVDKRARCLRVQTFRFQPRQGQERTCPSASGSWYNGNRHSAREVQITRTSHSRRSSFP